MKNVAVPLPGKIWVGTHEFPILLVPKDHPILIEDGVIAEGSTQVDPDHKYFGIYIAAYLRPRKRFEIVWHEVTHVVNWVASLGINAEGDDVPVDEEDMAAKHGIHWTQLLLDNPRFVKWITYMIARIHAEQKEHTDADSQESSTPRDTGHAVQAGSPAGPHAVGGAIRGDEKT